MPKAIRQGREIDPLAAGKADSIACARGRQAGDINKSRAMNQYWQKPA